MEAEGGLTWAGLPGEVQLTVFSFLPPLDVHLCCFTIVCFISILL